MAKRANPWCRKFIKKVEGDPIYLSPQVDELALRASLPEKPVPARKVDGGVIINVRLHYGHLLCSGIYAVVRNEDPQGWFLLRKYGHFLWLQSQFNRRLGDEGVRSGGISPSYAASAVAQLVTFGHANSAGWLANELANPERGGVASIAGRAVPFERFVVALYGVWKGGERVSMHAARKDLGPYAELFAEWDRPERLPEVFVRLADHHVAMSKSRAQFPVSFEGHEACWPFEFQAIWRVRNDAGLEMPTFEHELINNNPLFVPPPDLGPFSDPLYDTVAKALLGTA